MERQPNDGLTCHDGADYGVIEYGGGDDGCVISQGQSLIVPTQVAEQGRSGEERRGATWGKPVANVGCRRAMNGRGRGDTDRAKYYVFALVRRSPGRLRRIHCQVFDYSLSLAEKIQAQGSS